MDRRLLFPAFAITALAQQTSPAAAEAEKALRARAQQFFQLEVDKNFRAAWALVAEDTQDYFFNGGRPDIGGFEIAKIELENDNTRARVTIKAKTVMRAPGVPATAFETIATSLWKIENGQWFWYVDQSAGIDTPFGKIYPSSSTGASTGTPMPAMPTLDSLRRAVSIDKSTVVLSGASLAGEAEITNNSPGPVKLTISSAEIAGLTVDLGEKEIAAKQKARISFHAKPGSRPSGKVAIEVQPLGQHFEVTVISN